MVRDGEVKRVYSAAGGFQVKRKVSVSAADIGYGFVSGCVQQQPVFAFQQRIKVLEVRKRVVRIPLEVLGSQVRFDLLEPAGEGRRALAESADVPLHKPRGGRIS